jgi:hypothetical protein
MSSILCAEGNRRPTTAPEQIQHLFEAIDISFASGHQKKFWQVEWLYKQEVICLKL